MKAKLLCALLLACSISQASADTINITFTGMAFGGWTQPDSSVGHFNHLPITADFVFDTDLGTLTTLSDGSHHLDGGLVSATIDLGFLGVWGNTRTYERFGGGYLTWNDDLTSVIANAGILSYQLYVQNFLRSGAAGSVYGDFQFSLCPGSPVSPCGIITSIDSMAFIVVPAPIVGTGLPGLLLAGVLLLWHFRPAVFSRDVK